MKNSTVNCKKPLTKEEIVARATTHHFVSIKDLLIGLENHQRLLCQLHILSWCQKKAVGPGPFGVTIVESYSAHKKCALFVGWVDKYFDTSLYKLLSDLQFLHPEREFNLVCEAVMTG